MQRILKMNIGDCNKLGGVKVATELIFGAPISEIIKKRVSVRTYSEKPLLPETKASFHALNTICRGPFGGMLRFNLIDRDLTYNGKNLKLGTYGVIKGATTYIVAVIEKADKDLEDFGYSLEKIILYATSLGLGTCWLGGTFKKSEFSKAIEQKEHEILPCITPLGYPESRRTMLESAMRFAAGSNNRKEWNELFFSQDFRQTLSAAEAGYYATPLEMIRLAPSASNKQPWRIVKDTNQIHFYLQHTKGYTNASALDLQRVDIGIAMCHFELSARELGIAGKWRVSNPENINLPERTEYVVTWVEDI